MSFAKDLQKAAESALKGGSQAARQAGRKAGQLTHANRDKIDAAIDKAGKVVDDKTGRKYSSKIQTAKAQATKGMDLLEKQRAASAGPTVQSSTTGAPGTAGTPQDSLWSEGGADQPGQPEAYDAARDAAASQPTTGEFGTTSGEPGKDESGTSTP